MLQRRKSRDLTEETLKINCTLGLKGRARASWALPLGAPLPNIQFKAAGGLKVMPMVKCKLNFGKWVGGEIENGSQKNNNYAVFPRVSMIIPAPQSRFYIFHTDDSKTSKLSVPLTTRLWIVWSK